VLNGLTWIYALPSWLFFFAVVAVMGLLAAAGLLIFQRFVPPRDEFSHNDVAGPIIGTVGTILAVVLSFLLIENWQEYDAAATTTALEASAVADLYHSAAYFPAPTGQELQRAIRVYVHDIVDREWPEMRNGGESATAARESLAISGIVGRYQPNTAAQQALQQNAMTLINSFQDGRRVRLWDNEQGIPMIFWAGNVLLAALTIGLSYLFRVRKRWVHVLMSTSLACVIGVMFVLTAEFDYPFRGDGQIQPTTWVRLQHVIDRDVSLNQAH
jgi:hypothetical protein